MREKDWRRIFALRLGVQLRRNNMSQGELARRIRISPAAVSQFLAGTRRPDLTTAINMCQVFNCTLRELIDVGDDIRD